MLYAQVAVDISSRGVDGTFDYEIPHELVDSCGIGTTVLVPFSGRRVVGYVMALGRTVSEGLDPARVRPIERVLAESAFDEVSARLARWIAREYACPLCEAIHLFLAPGQTIRVRRGTDEAWELVCERSGPVDERWARLADAAHKYQPRSNAVRQRGVLEALEAGPMRVAELIATLPGSSAAIGTLARRGVIEIETRRRIRQADETTLSSARAMRPESLTAGQSHALDAIRKACAHGQGDVVLVDGVTGSGKTEVYLDAIEEVFKRGQGAIVLVPEISLTAQTVGRFRSRFGDAVAVLHSRLSSGERFDQWDLILKGVARVVVGARSALFAPLANVGLIVIDEEHETSYKQGSAPRYHAREVAARLAHERGCALVLGSATPSLESLTRCKDGVWQGAHWQRVVMEERPGGARLPRVHVVDMTQQFSKGNRSIFSAPLAQALLGVAERREKAVLLLNRRGFATFLMCRECGAVPECPHCSTALTYHERSHSLVCHTCGRSWPFRAWPDPTTRCPNCGSRYLAAFGVGTQRVEDELAALLGDDVEIIRMDADTTSAKGGHQRLLERFDAAECAVLVGTQMIAKGLDFPEVTVVGVVNADTTLKLPDFRAAERTYDLLEQVAGRAGRGREPGEVFIQTYWAGHPAMQAVLRHDRSLFLTSELKDRRDGYYPPFARLTNITCWGKSATEVRSCLDELAAGLRSDLAQRSDWEVLGPADCLKARVKDRIRRHVLVKSPLDAEPGPVISEALSRISVPRGVSVAIDVDAYDLM